jgi:hypothetical protein
MRTLGFLALGGAVAALALLGAASARADVGQEIATAEQHAGYAAGSDDVAKMQAHLHHVVNCLVGPKGRGFDEAQANPCKDQGAGVMPDFKGDKTKRQTLQKALDTARAGLKATDAKVVKQRAADADTLLKKAM